MTISTQLNARAMWDDYAEASEEERDAVTEARDDVLRVFRRNGFVCPGDDRLAELEAVLFNYLKEAN